MSHGRHTATIVNNGEVMLKTIVSYTKIEQDYSKAKQSYGQNHCFMLKIYIHGMEMIV